MNRRKFAARLLLLPLLLVSHACGQDENAPPTSLYDPRLGEIRRSQPDWERRRGPSRRVVDQVVLVPDVPSFLRAIAAWDQRTWFPILIDDAELAPKFLRAFRPAKVLRFSVRSLAPEPSAQWTAAIEAVGRAWAPEINGPPDPLALEPTVPRGDQRPDWIDDAPPAVVVTRLDSPALAGAVALAAGRFQPLVRWEPQAIVGRIGEEDAKRLTIDLEATVAALAPRHAGLRDDCDFLTLAAPYPDRYVISGSGLKAGVAALDDLFGREGESLRRWAFTGRLMGDPSESVYRAMCALFLQPESALLFDGYDPNDPDFRPYSMRTTPLRLERDMKVALVQGAAADVNGWDRAVEPINRHGLVIVNTSGGVSSFNLSGGTIATAGDIPPTVPAVVLMNHSFSAADPGRPDTLAGAWLSGGAYLYFGALNEPYIQSFRTPTLVSSLLAEGLPFAAAVRMGVDESLAFGTPWRLHLLGDPLFRIDSRAAQAPRWPDYGVTAAWPPYAAEGPPAASAGNAARLGWLVKETLLEAARGDAAPSPAALAALLEIRRDGLPASLRPVLDGLRIDALPRAGDRGDDLIAKLAEVPEAEVSPRVRRALLSARVGRLRRAIASRNWPEALARWEQIQAIGLNLEMRGPLTRSVGDFAQSSGHLTTWQSRVRKALEVTKDPNEARTLDQELKRNPGTAPTNAPTRSVRRGR